MNHDNTEAVNENANQSWVIFIHRHLTSSIERLCSLYLVWR